MWKLVAAPDRGDLLFPRSHCPACGAHIRRRHLLPLISYAMLRGRCADCGAAISIRYPLVEFSGALSALIALYLFGVTFTAAFAFSFFLFVITLGVIDHETGYLPDVLTLPLLGLGLFANGLGLFSTSVASAAIGAIIGYGAFRLVEIAFRRLRGVDGLGQGDAKLLAALGAWFGWAVLPPIVFLAAIFALAGAGAAVLRGGKIDVQTPTAFGPALAGAGALAMIAQGLRLPFFF